MSVNLYNAERYLDPTAYEALMNIEREAKRTAYKPLVFICSPFAGNIERNTRRARDFCRFAVSENCIPIAPHLLFPQFMEESDPQQRRLGIFFVVPFLMLGLPIFDTAFAFIRRIAHGQSPMHADRSHVHHRLIDMGFSQKQAVAVLYIISAILGLSAVVLTTGGPEKAMLLLLALCAAGAVAGRIFLHNNEKKNGAVPEDRPSGDGKEDGE